MPRYTIRVELHQATWDNYKQLADNLARYGITDIITGEKGGRFKMPPAEYNYDGPADRAKVLDIAKAAASSTGRTYGVLVTESNGRSWEGLAQVK